MVNGFEPIRAGVVSCLFHKNCIANTNEIIPMQTYQSVSQWENESLLGTQEIRSRTSLYLHVILG